MKLADTPRTTLMSAKVGPWLVRRPLHCPFAVVDAVERCWLDVLSRRK